MSRAEEDRGAGQSLLKGNLRPEKGGAPWKDTSLPGGGEPERCDPSGPALSAGFHLQWNAPVFLPFGAACIPSVTAG